MNLPLPTGPLAQAIGWTLIQFVWQGASVAALLAVLLTFLSGRSASLRYAIACAALVLIVALGVATAFRETLRLRDVELGGPRRVGFDHLFRLADHLPVFKGPLHADFGIRRCAGRVNRCVDRV